MITLFNIAPQDQSVYYLSQLFGYMGSVLPAVNTNIMGVMFKTINTSSLVLGTYLLLQTTIVGLLKTAQEGEFLGRQWSSVWLPLRTLGGIACLFPTVSGYSILQVAIMWFLIQGVGAADTVWTTVLNYIANTGSVFASMTPAPMGVQQSFTNLAQALVCQSEAARSDTDQYTAGSSGTDYYYFYCAVGGPNTQKGAVDPFCAQTANDMLNITSTNTSGGSAAWSQVNITNGYYNYNMGPKGSCGVLKFPDPKTYADTGISSAPVCSLTDNAQAQIECGKITAQVPALQAVVTSLGTLAATIAEYDHQYMVFFDSTTPAPPANIPSFITNFCEANKIPTSACCFYTNPANCAPPGTPPPASGAPPPPCSDCQDPTVGGALPMIYSKQGNVNDNTNISKAAATSLYWTYGLMPGLGSAPDVIGTNVTYYLSQVVGAPPASLTGWQASAQATGWLLAGTYYYKIAGITNSNQALPPMQVTSADPFVTANSPMQNYRNNYEGMGFILSAISGANASTISPSSASAPAAQTANNTLNSASNNIVNNFETNLTGSQGATSDPLLSVQQFGEALLITAQVTFATVIGVAVVILILANLNVIVFGSGLTKNPIGPGAMFALVSTLSVIFAFCGWCISFGGMLAIYTPLIPYIVFTFGTIGWFGATIEAMVAAPFIALGILSPGGHHEILGRAEPAVMILLNSFLRPTLMIIGMMAAMLLVPLVVQLINGTFNAVVGSIYSGSTMGPVELILFVTSYATLIVTAMNKCFTLIYIVPERVLTWIGGHAISYGEGESLQAVKQSAEKTSESLGSALEGAAAFTVSTLQKVGKKKKSDASGTIDGRPIFGPQTEDEAKHEELTNQLKALEKKMKKGGAATMNEEARATADEPEEEDINAMPKKKKEGAGGAPMARPIDLDEINPSINDDPHEP